MVSLKSVAGSTGSKPSMVRLMLIVLAAIVLFALVAYYNGSSRPRSEGFNAVTSAPQPMPAPMPMPAPAPAPAPSSSASATPRKGSMSPAPAAASSADLGPVGIEPFGNDQHRPVGTDRAVGTSVSEAFPQDRLKPEDLLPRDAANSKWAQMNPAGQGDVKDQNFLTAGYHVGFDTQGSSMRNASHDFRSTPPNPRYNVSIWSQSTIEPDLNRRPLE